MWEVMISALRFAAGLVPRSLIMGLRDTAFYDKYLSKRVADASNRILGPRVQIRPVGLVKAGFEHNPFHVMRVEVINRRRVPGDSVLDPKYLPKLEEVFNLFFCHPVANARVYTQFFNSRGEPLPEPERAGIPTFGLPVGVWVTLERNDRAEVDVAVLSRWGDCYGVNRRISETLLLRGTGDPNLDTPLQVGEFYLEVSVVDDKRSITYAVSHFLFKYGGSAESFHLLAAKPSFPRCSANAS